MINTIKKVFNSQYFHGRLSDDEAYNLCKEELTNSAKQRVYIWYLSEYGGSLQGRICGYRRNSEVPFFRHVGSLSNSRFGRFNRFLDASVLYAKPPTKVFVKRKNPHTLSELARVATLDNCNGYCCLTSLIEKIDEFQIPRSEKEELKKLARGFERFLVENLPNELCIHN